MSNTVLKLLRYPPLPVLVILVEAVLGTLWGSGIFISFCVYPEDVPCNTLGFVFSLMLFSFLGILVVDILVCVIAVIIDVIETMRSRQIVALVNTMTI